MELAEAATARPDFLMVCCCLVLPLLGWKDAPVDVATEGQATRDPPSLTRIRWAVEESFAVPTLQLP